MTKKYLAILGGGIKKNRNGKWISTDLTESRSFRGAPGGKIRVVAASYLSKNDPDTNIIATGGQGYDKNIQGKKHPGLANIIERELIELGIPKSKIIKESKSNTTYQQLIELTKFIKKYKIKDLGIISSKWHLPRIKAMISCVPKLQLLKQVKFISAESVCLKYDKSSWQKKIDRADMNQGLNSVKSLERKGVKDIKKGKYEYK
jgi:hypothetical protein